MTPEGKVKASVNKLLSQYAPLYRYMPVPGGYGASSLDYLVCYRGRFISIETKAPGRKPTDRQKLTAAQIARAGGAVFVVDGPDTLAELKSYLDRITQDDPSPNLEEAPDRRGAVL